ELPSSRYRVKVNNLAISYELSAVEPGAMSNLQENQIGINRPITENVDSRAVTIRNSDGSRLRVFSLKSPGAEGLRIHFEDFDLPDGDQVFVYGTSADSHVSGPHTGRGPFNDGEFWSDLIEGDTVIVEHFSRSRVHSTVRVAEIGHAFTGLDSPAFVPQLLSCQVDASCGSFEERDAVGRILYSRSGGQFVCTGTMLNNVKSDKTPFFLTAAHCVSTEDVARTVQTFWFYQTTSCNSPTLRQSATSGTGTTLLATEMTDDQTLLRVLGAIPAGVAFVGWDANQLSLGSVVYGLHHPGGGVPPSAASFLRSAGGTITAQQGCGASGLGTGYIVLWTSGTTEPGSSGSALFSGSGSGLIGVLSCGPTNQSCTQGLNLGLYGRFSDFYPRISQFLLNGSGAFTCVTGLAPGSRDFGAGAGSGSVNVSAPAGCNWTATTDATWVTFSGAASGSGNGTVSYDVAPNPFSSPRSTTISVQGMLHTINQAGFVCNYSVSPTDRSFTAAGGSADLSVSATPNCPWNAGSNASWLRITLGTQGTGDGTVKYTVDPNNSQSARIGQITVEGRVHTVNQNGLNCTFNIAPASAAVSRSGGGGTIAVTVQAGCIWNATSNASWLTFNGAASGTGNGSVNYSVAPNNGAATRSGRITIVDKFFDVTQAAGPTISGAMVEGKRLIVVGVNFGLDAVLFMDGAKQKKTFNDDVSPSTMLVAMKSGKNKISVGQTVTLQVRNPDNTLSPEFPFTRAAATSGLPMPRTRAANRAARTHHK
ncbi:MAG TPA: BACON domain-containing carbohydrate-binding protein, partial [Blastocatellia bacterium]|nr:BACON domain-containing carbohydrate-binding protein [Blastocatellia bacterium]